MFSIKLPGNQTEQAYEKPFPGKNVLQLTVSWAVKAFVIQKLFKGDTRIGLLLGGKLKLSIIIPGISIDVNKKNDLTTRF
jgi:hypothetical protein